MKTRLSIPSTANIKGNSSIIVNPPFFLALTPVDEASMLIVSCGTKIFGGGFLIVDLNNFPNA